MPDLFLPVQPANQAAMVAYMRHQFKFLGVRAGERRQLTQPYLKTSQTLTSTELQDWLVFYYGQPFREYHYVAIDLALANVRRLTPSQYEWCRQQVTHNAWWDSVDSWRKLLATYIEQQQHCQNWGQHIYKHQIFGFGGLALSYSWAAGK
ncbi:hypothetical protein C5Z26_03090 [Lactobacillus sp. CBA3606]|uniref:DNA alkylation repair protein n=1 Tax=Lactobacillus sp. CBA3606 TaxID=2099789 RepID=UPI000CFD21E5|nr:DNA alkylation repair protein [Lactobacillus sp. CBA3606]AVK63171.1 hypothetical protein C5Z26_03090 [Lactobacillus sp. CBA3606]